jgi:hypothetical protein
VGGGGGEAVAVEQRWAGLNLGEDQEFWKTLSLHMGNGVKDVHTDGCQTFLGQEKSETCS